MLQVHIGTYLTIEAVYGCSLSTTKGDGDPGQHQVQHTEYCYRDIT